MKLCDDALAEKAGIYSKGESLPIYLKVRRTPHYDTITALYHMSHVST